MGMGCSHFTVDSKILNAVHAFKGRRISPNLCDPLSAVAIVGSQFMRTSVHVRYGISIAMPQFTINERTLNISPIRKRRRRALTSDSRNVAWLCPI
jgi:hypothetical protein